MKKILLLSFLVLPFSLQAQDYSLDATYGEISLNSNELRSLFSMNIAAGGSINAANLGDGCIGNIANAPDLQITFSGNGSALQFAVEANADTSLVINNPGGDWICDDDGWEGLNPLVSLSDPDDGVYDIWVGTYDSEEMESSTIIIGSNLPDAFDASLLSSVSEDSDTDENGYMGNVETGRLSTTDSQYEDGSYQDIHSFRGIAGQEVVIDLTSEDFDSFLVLHSPQGEEFVNDDFNGERNRSLLSLTLEETGNYEIIVTSYTVGETGEYRLGLEVANSASSQLNETLRGVLSSSDETLSDGEYFDSFTFTGRAGQSINVDLRSDDFDTFVILETPGGSHLVNDDSDTNNHSVIDTELSESGTFNVHVTSYQALETGDYVLTLTSSESAAGNNSSRDTVNLSMGNIIEGNLAENDVQNTEDRYEDYYSFSGQQGQLVRVSLNSNPIDTMLRVVMPDGSELENDDYDGSQDQSLIEFRLPQGGRYSVIATSYRESETGPYQILATLPDTPITTTGMASSTGGEVYGVFVGISDYSELRRSNPGWGDLSYTDEDAIVTRDALIDSGRMRPENALTFTNLGATVENINGAFAELSQRVGPEDTFVFFYSGHGGQVPRISGPNAADADGFDETLALSSGIITDDEVSVLFDSINSRVSLIILDSCYSGGFAKDIVSRPGRMGLFSSDEDVPSLVAQKFEAGGYLSHFFREAVEGDRADRNQDNAINAMELSQYLHERYSAESLSKGPSNFDTPNFGYQHLIADRGGVPYDAIIFRR